MLKYKKLSINAYVPTRGSELAAGYDLYSAYDYEVPAEGRKLIRTDLQLKFPEGTYGRIAPRSGLALSNFITVGGGVIDPDYCGDVGVIIFNHAQEKFLIRKGDRIAQIILEKAIFPELIECKEMELDTKRGKNGFGSTDQDFLKKNNEDDGGVGKNPHSPILDLSKKKKVDDGDEKKEEENSTEVILDFEGFTDSNGNFIIKEMALAFLDSQDVICFIIQSPCKFEDLAMDKQILVLTQSNSYNGIKWTDGNLTLGNAIILFKILSKHALRIWTMGEDNCEMFSKFLKNNSVKNLKKIGCPDSDRIMYNSDFKSCPLHQHNIFIQGIVPKYNCALIRVQKYRLWFWKSKHFSPKKNLSSERKKMIRKFFDLDDLYLDGDDSEIYSGPVSLTLYSADNDWENTSSSSDDSDSADD